MGLDTHRQCIEWQHLYDAIQAVLGAVGTEYVSGEGDFWLLEDNWGHPMHKVLVRKLELLHPDVISKLRSLLADYPHWEIGVGVDVPGPGEAWPEMGLTLRKHEIVDGLQRQYFPPEFRNLRYCDARPGTAFD